MESINAVLSSLPENKTVKAVLPLKNSNNKLRLNGVIHVEEPPIFTLLFPEDHLEESAIDHHRKCSVIIDVGGQNISMAADITGTDAEQLQLIARDFINHESVREFFRVDTQTPVVLTSLIPPDLSGSAPWKLAGETIDLSASGLLATFPEQLKLHQRVRIHLILPTGEAPIIPIVGHAIRSKKIDEGVYQAAFHYDQISSEDQDRIMACCFEIQRRQLRLQR
jgi:c-di-GMP-binding flagellar brake protein YcgR